MHFEPADISRDAILRLLGDAYAIEAVRAEFIPVGAATACYRVESHGGFAFFVKTWPGSPGGEENSARQEGVLPFLRLLDEFELPFRVPAPLLANDGRPYAFLPGSETRVAVFHFIDGDSPGDEAGVPGDLIGPLAEAVAAYHGELDLPPSALPPHDPLDIAFEETLRDALARLSAVGDDARPGLREARERLAAREADIANSLAVAASFQARAHRLQSARVLCHTDLGGSNLLVDPVGQLTILDWDEACMAPPEHDLQAAASSSLFAEFLRVYRETGGAEELHLDHFAFYLARRYLADMTYRLLLLLDYNTTAEEDADALYGIEAYGFARFADFDRLLAHIEASLRDAGY